MQAATLNRRVTIRKLDTVLDEYGEPVSGWVDWFTAWADIRQLSGLETVRSNVEVSEVKASIRLRYRTGLSASMIAVHDGKNYEIEAVLMDVHDREFIDLICKVM